MNLRVVIPSALAAIGFTGIALFAASYGLARLFHWTHSLSPGEVLAARACIATAVAVALIAGLVLRRSRAAAVA